MKRRCTYCGCEFEVPESSGVLRCQRCFEDLYGSDTPRRNRFVYDNRDHFFTADYAEMRSRERQYEHSLPPIMITRIDDLRNAEYRPILSRFLASESTRVPSNPEVKVTEVPVETEDEKLDRLMAMVDFRDVLDRFEPVYSDPENIFAG